MIKKFKQKHYFTSPFRFEGKDECILTGLRLTQLSVPSRQAVIVVNGRGENVSQFEELYDDIMRNDDVDLFTYDHRGQGYSERLVKGSKHRGHVDNFDDYVYDLNKFYETFIEPHGYKELFIVAHSMGGAVAAKWLIDKVDGGDPLNISGLFLSAPMFGVNSPIPSFLAIPALEVLSALGMGDKYLIGSPGKPSIGGFENNKLTRDRKRYSEMCANNLFSDGSVNLVRPTNKWTLSSLKAIKFLQKNLDKLSYIDNGHIFQAGQEQYVDNNSHYKAPKGWMIRRFIDEFHCLLQSRDPARSTVLSIINQSLRGK